MIAINTFGVGLAGAGSCRAAAPRHHFGVAAAATDTSVHRDTS
jgi:hypothetical protein